MTHTREKNRAKGFLAAGFCAAVLIANAPAHAGDGADAAAVTVNGVAIAVGAVEAEYRWILNQKQMFHTINSEQETAGRREAVDRVVVWELVRQKLAADGKAVTPQEVEARVAEDRARIGDSFQRYIAMLGQDEGSYRRRNESIQNFRRFQKEHIVPQLKLSDDEVRAHYAKADTYRSAEGYRVRYLQVSSVDNAGRLMHGDLAAVAAKARKRVVEGGALEAVAEKLTNSQVTCRVSNGYYEIGKTPLYEPALKSLAKSGDISEVLKVTENSYLIFILEEKVPAKVVKLEEARPEIERLLLEVKMEAAIPGHVAALKKQARITYVDPKYAPGE